MSTQNSAVAAIESLSDDFNNVGLCIEQALWCTEWGRQVLLSRVYISHNPTIDNFVDLVALGQVHDISGLVGLVNGRGEEGFEQRKGFSAFTYYRFRHTCDVNPVPYQEALRRFETRITDYATIREVLGLIMTNRAKMWGLLDEDFRLIALGRDAFNGQGRAVIFYRDFDESRKKRLCMEQVCMRPPMLWEPLDLLVIRA